MADPTMGRTNGGPDGGVAITVVAYEAESSIWELLDRIPATVCGAPPLVLVSDDASTDRTTELAQKWAAENGSGNTLVRRHPRNLGYGGNQKAGYEWAAEEGADIAVLLGATIRQALKARYRAHQRRART